MIFTGKITSDKSLRQVFSEYFRYTVDKSVLYRYSIVTEKEFCIIDVEIKQESFYKMSKKVKFGIIGIGNMGTAHSQMMENISNVELVAVCDINEKAFDRMTPATREKVNCYTDVNEFFKDPQLEAVLPRL